MSHQQRKKASISCITLSNKLYSPKKPALFTKHRSDRARRCARKISTLSLGHSVRNSHMSPASRRYKQEIRSVRSELRAAEKRHQRLRHLMNAEYTDLSSAIYMILMDLEDQGIAREQLEKGWQTVDTLIAKRHNGRRRIA